MWLTAALVVVLFLAIAASLAVLALRGPELWQSSMDRATRRRTGKRFQNIMSYETGIDDNEGGMEPLIPEVVRRLPDALDTGTWVPGASNLSRTALLDILARQMVDNRYVFSGNKLVDLFAGTPAAASRNVILEEIAAIRREERPKPTARLERPANGW